MAAAKKGAAASAAAPVIDETPAVIEQTAPAAVKSAKRFRLIGAGSFTPLNFPEFGCIRKGQTVEASGGAADYLSSVGLFEEE